MDSKVENVVLLQKLSIATRFLSLGFDPLPFACCYCLLAVTFFFSDDIVLRKSQSCKLLGTIKI